MSIALDRLLGRAFHTEDVNDVTEALERARREYEARTKAGARSFEVVAPREVDDDWIRDRLLRPLVYFCQSAGTPLPACTGVFLSLFVGTRLHCIAVGDVVDWAREALGLSAADLVERYGTHELDTALR